MLLPLDILLKSHFFTIQFTTKNPNSVWDSPLFLVSEMNRLVLGTVAELFESHVTVLARIRPLVGVHPDVHNQVLFLFERLAAVLAAKLFVNVHPFHVPIDLSLASEF